jgi:hypothetical protein
MKRLGIITAFVMLLAAVSAAAALATQSTTINAANAPSGTHFKSGTATCSVSSTGVSCSSYTLAGVGHTNASVDLKATYTATVVCVNNGTHTSDGQHQGSFPKETGPIPLTPDKNGNLPVPSTSSTAPSQSDFLAQQTCPNPNWTPTVPGGITLQSFTYTLTFAGFSGAYITITGNDP